MNYPCANATKNKCTPNAGVSKFKFQSGKSYRLRLVNTGAEGLMKFSIDNHKLTVFANDFVPIVPYDTDVITLGVGQRSDIVVKATGKPTDAVWMRAELGPSFLDGGCSLTDGVSTTGLAAVYYEDANTDSAPQGKSPVPVPVLKTCKNDDLTKTVPFYSAKPGEPDTVKQLDITHKSNGTNALWYVNESSFRANYNDPVLLDIKDGNDTFPADYNIVDFGASKSIRLVIYNHGQTGAHPMHMHGHNMYILAEGSGKWDGTITNPNNPQRRDVQLLQNATPDTPSYIVVQFDADNPGVWPMHCHVAWHVSEGLYINMVERPDDIRKDREIPDVMAQTCRDWDAWSNRHVVDEIDSGLKMRNA